MVGLGGQRGGEHALLHGRDEGAAARRKTVRLVHLLEPLGGDPQLRNTSKYEEGRLHEDGRVGVDAVGAGVVDGGPVQLEEGEDLDLRRLLRREGQGRRGVVGHAVDDRDLLLQRDLYAFGFEIAGREQDGEELAAVAGLVETLGLDRLVHAAIEDAGPGDEDVVGGARSQTSRLAELHRILVGLLDLGEHGEVGRADIRGEPGDLVHVGHRERLEDVLGIEVSFEVLLPRSNVRGLVRRVWAHPAGVAVDRDGVDGVEGGSG